MSESFSGGPLAGLTVTNSYDMLLRRSAVGLSNYAATLTTFGYDPASRLSTVTNGDQTVSYTYLPNSPLVQSLIFKQNGTTRMTTTKSYDNLNRLTAISSAPSASSAVTFNYTYNNANQRIRTVLADGCITGKTTGPEQLPYNQFIIWRGGVVKNFELHAKVKQAGNNSGIQYRSKELPAVGKWSASGYQCDIHPNTPFNSMVYEERGRGIVTQNGQSLVIDPQGAKWLVAKREPVKVDVAEWHDYTIIAQGNHLIHKLDGKLTIDLVDYDEKARAFEGILAFQIHRGPAMNVQIKDVLLKELPEGGVIPFKPSAIPSDATPLTEKKAPAAAAKPQIETPKSPAAEAPDAKNQPK